MKDIFESKTASPMLLTESIPFNSKDYIYELKLDGIRCLAYIEDGKTELRNKRNKILNDTYPELTKIHERVCTRCILDGELVVLSNGKPNFFQVQKRSLMTNKFKIDLASRKHPVLFIAYDILYVDDSELIFEPLMERKEILDKVISENQSISISRYIEEKGIEYFNIVASQDLEGVIAKRKDSIYLMGKRSKSWVKFKNLYDTDFVICGYTPNDSSIKSLKLGIYNDNKLIYQGSVSLGIPKEEEKIILDFARNNKDICPFENSTSKEAIWIKPRLVCTVKYMMRTESGSLRQPIYKGLRKDKTGIECTTDQFN